ncbi:hypothetical protein CP533_1919, partial [Ophiocordyceps camponoti-saundersi (nom. inval.)]
RSSPPLLIPRPTFLSARTSVFLLPIKPNMSAPSIPAGGTIVQTFKTSFVDVPIDADKGNAVATTPFLDAAESLTTIFDVLGSVAFSPVKSDMMGNIKVRYFTALVVFSAQMLNSLVQKVRDRQLAAPAESENVQDLCRNELKEKKHTATEGLLWLVRGLEFTCIALSQNLAKVSEELADSFRGAYGQTLKPHHSFIVKPIFSAAMSACPYRKDFYAKLGSDQPKVEEDLRVYLASLEKIVGILKGFLDTKEAKW